MASVIKEIYSPKYDTYSGEVAYGQITINLPNLPFNTTDALVDYVLANGIQPALNQYNFELLYLGVGEVNGWYGLIPTTKYIVDIQFIPKSEGTSLTAPLIVLALAVAALGLIVYALSIYWGSLVTISKQITIWWHGYNPNPEPVTKEPPTINETIIETSKNFSEMIKWGAIGLVGIGVLLLASEFTSIKGASKLRRKVTSYAM